VNKQVLPTRGAARSSGGLSVFTFLRVRTWLQIDDLDECQDVVKDAIALARLEGLEGHARSAEKRLLAPVASTTTATNVASDAQKTVAVVNPEKPITPADSVLQFALPKGRMEQEIIQLMSDAGIKITIPSRGYRPSISIPGVDVKLLNPRNVTQMVRFVSLATSTSSFLTYGLDVASPRIS
jgi:hypothetical protein